MLTYRYAIGTSFTLKLGNITDRTILTPVERMVNCFSMLEESFNFTAIGNINFQFNRFQHHINSN